MTTLTDGDEIESLRAQVLRLTEENLLLRERLSFLEGHPTMAAGIRGEKLVARLLTGQLTSHRASHDVELSDGVRIEVKYSGLNAPSSTVSTLRWAWTNVFGYHDSKKFDFLLLIGLADPRYREFYKDPASPYVFFLVPFNQIEPLTIKLSKVRGVQLTTNPKKSMSAAHELFSMYQFTAKELEERFKV